MNRRECETFIGGERRDDRSAGRPARGFDGHMHRALIDMTAKPVFVHDMRGRIVLANAAFSRSFGVNAEGKPVEACGDIGFDTCNAELFASLDALLSGEERAHSVVMRHACGERLSVNVRSRGVMEDDVPLLVSNIESIDTQKRQPPGDIPRGAHEELYDLAFSIMTHDLRNQMSAVLAGLEVIAITAHVEFPEQLHSYLAKARSEVFSALRLIDNITRWSALRIKGVRPTPEAIDARNVIERAVDLCREAACRKQVSVECAVRPGTMIVAVEDVASSVFHNVLFNSIKYCRERGSVLIESRSAPGFTLIDIGDDGIGIDRDCMKSLFSPDKRCRRVGTSGELGSGLGLFVCRQLMDLSGGSIEVRSEVGVGTRVTIGFPVGGAAGTENAQAAD